jgi:ParB family chromosome partitioning protein
MAGSKSKMKGIMDSLRNSVHEQGGGQSNQERDEKPKSMPGAFKHRLETLPTHATPRKNELKVQLKIDPQRCRIWTDHDRRYDLLNEANCADLIEGFRAQGQRIPAIVREITDDPDHEYEIIVGTRRHWTASYLGVPYLIEVQSLTDQQAFVLVDAENRQRKDISDYERAVFYANALKQFYKTQKEMAEAMQTSTAWLNEYIALAAFPKEVVACYRDINEIKVTHSRKLTPMLKDSKQRQRILERAKTIKDQPLDGAGVLKVLSEAVKPKRGGGVNFSKDYTLDKQKAFSVSKSGKGGLNIKIDPKFEGSLDALLSLMADAVRENI